MKVKPAPAGLSRYEFDLPDCLGELPAPSASTLASLALTWSGAA